VTVELLLFELLGQLFYLTSKGFFLAFEFRVLFWADVRFLNQKLVCFLLGKFSLSLLKLGFHLRDPILKL